MEIHRNFFLWISTEFVENHRKKVAKITFSCFVWRILVWGKQQKHWNLKWFKTQNLTVVKNDSPLRSFFTAILRFGQLFRDICMLYVCDETLCFFLKSLYLAIFCSLWTMICFYVQFLLSSTIKLFFVTYYTINPVARPGTWAHLIGFDLHKALATGRALFNCSFFVLFDQYT